MEAAGAPETALGWRDALRRGEISAREATEHFLTRIEDRAELGAFLTVTAEQARAAATRADERCAATPHREREHLPALHGLPTAFKDLVDVAGAATTRGSAALRHPVAATDAPGVAMLRAAGVIPLGKTQVPELGLTGYSENAIAPPARNPLDPTRTPGGSSGGSAAAIAAGLIPLGPGTDGGGSIRIPALACGLVGLKPGLGAVPGDLGSSAAPALHDEFGAPRLTVSGPLAVDAHDAAMLYDAQRGAAGEPALRAVRTAGALTGLRIGYSEDSPFSSVYPITIGVEARRAADTVIARLTDRGHRLEPTRFAYDPEYPDAFTTSWTAGLSRLPLAEDAAERLMPLTRAFRERALARSEEAHARAGARLRDFAADVRAQWGAYDAVLTPGLTMLPPRVGAFTSLDADDDYRLQCEWAPFTSMVNVSGLPAIAVPVLRLATGHAMGVQLIGRTGAEELLLRLAAQLTTH